MRSATTLRTRVIFKRRVIKGEGEGTKNAATDVLDRNDQFSKCLDGGEGERALRSWHKSAGATPEEAKKRKEIHEGIKPAVEQRTFLKTRQGENSGHGIRIGKKRAPSVVETEMRKSFEKKGGRGESQIREVDVVRLGASKLKEAKKRMP